MKDSGCIVRVAFDKEPFIRLADGGSTIPLCPTTTSRGARFCVP
jgi:hypothetical protein